MYGSIVQFHVAEVVMSHTAYPRPIQAVMLAALSEQFDLLRRLMADADPKVSLRASAEMSKLMGICARNNLTPELPVEVVPPEPPAVPPPVPHPPAATASLLTDVLAEPKPASARQPLAPDRRAEPDPRLRPLSPAGKRLTSFLGQPTPAQIPPDRGKTV
jgi:hypothetical protein